MLQRGFAVSFKSQYSTSLRLTMKVDWDWGDTSLREAGWTLDGSISSTLKFNYYIEAKLDKETVDFFSGNLGGYRSPVSIESPIFKILVIVLNVSVISC